MILDQMYSAPLLPVDTSNMSNYRNIPTPPSSNEDSPQPVYFVASPNSSSFHAPEDYDMARIPFNILTETQPMIDPNVLMGNQTKASLHFVEQPIDRFRFRYKSEMAGTHGSLTGMNSDKSRKQTYPTVELKNCTTTAIIRCSIYQINGQGPHAHRLIMKKGKDEHDDPHDLVVGPEDGWRATFHAMGIIHTAKKNLVTELVRKRTQLKMEYIAREEGKSRKLTIPEEVEIKGLAEDESKSINLNIVCLRFDAFIKHNDKLYPICEPIFSHGINNLKSALTGELKIVRLDHVSSPACGGKEVFVLVERVTKKNIKIRFFELDDKDEEIWTDEGKFNDLDVHHQYAIVFKTPKYRDENIDKPVKVYVELVRPSDNARSEPREFSYHPVQRHRIGSKRPRYDSYYSSSSYNSSNVASDELPAVINSLNLGQNHVQNTTIEQQVTTTSWEPPTDQLLTSAELAVAINNIDSDEFRRLFSQFDNDYVSTVMDGPRKTLRMVQNKTMYMSNRIHTQSAPAEPRLRSAIKLEVSEEHRLMAHRVYEELYSFSKTSHKPQEATKMILFYLGKENNTNALHIFICQNNVEYAKFLLNFILVKGLFELVNVKNSDMETPLQLAVRCHNEVMVKYLMACKAKVGILNDKMNTALHTAIDENVPVDILQELLMDREHEKVSEYIDLRNNDGNTALIIAIEHRNISALKLLSMKGADINKRDQKSGFTPLRLAIERQHLDSIRYILSIPNLEPLTRDFQDISALRAAHQRECSKEILDVIEKYMVENSLELDIKEELEEESDEEMEDVLEVKHEDICPHDLKKMYKQVNVFTPQCLDEVAAILNESGRWEDLANLLGHSHLIRSGMISQEHNVSKNLLKYAVESHNDTLWEIREFLEVLDEVRAVEAMDRMVQST